MKPQLHLFNTLSRTSEPFEPVESGKVGIYACGPTVYDYTHLGHLRKYAMDDVLVRALKYLNFQVTFVQNITDVGHLTSDADTGEDKLEKGARKYNQSVWEVARRFEAYFFRSMQALNILAPDISCRATEHIAEQLTMVEALERQGHTYVIPDDGVYFDVSTFPHYTRLAQLQLENQAGGVRISDAAKRNSADFALWKFEREGEQRAMVWPSPWAERSFPGWHIECSAMAHHYLGEEFDIHTGGIDHIPVHHTNEIAQTESFTEHSPWVRYWVHHNFLQVEGQKMSKSLGNFYTVDDVIKKGYDPLALRLLFLSAHYRSEMNFTWQNLAGAQTALEKLRKHVGQLVQDLGKTRLAAVTTTSEAEQRQLLSKPASKMLEMFEQQLANDLNTPELLAILWQVVKSRVPSQEKAQLLLRFDQVLGLGIDQWEFKAQSEPLPPAVQTLVEQRRQAREQKDWHRSDQLRQELESNGYQVIDGSSGQQLTSKSQE